MEDEIMSTDITQQPGMDISQAQAIAALPPDMMLLKMENESIMSVARATPRDPMKIVGQLQQLIDAYPAAADDAIYQKPVGTVMEITCECGIKYEANIKWVQRKPVAEQEPCPECGEWKPKNQKPIKKYAEGLSARAAESIRSIFGYTRLATTTEILADGNAKLTGTLVDYAAGNITTDERIVSRCYRSRDGKMVSIAEDRFLNLTVKSELSKLRRDVILLSTPNIVKACFQDACEAKIRGLISDEVIEQKIIPAFEAVGISAADLDKIIGKPHALGWKEEDRVRCRKILTALKNEETNVRDLLDGIKEQSPQPQQKKDGATMDDLTKPTVQHPSPPDAPLKSQDDPHTSLPPSPDPSADADTIDEFRDQVDQADTIQAVQKLIVDYTAAVSCDAAREKVKLQGEVRIQQIRANRGQRSNQNQKSMLDGGASATESGH
jgi:hypothetical protein